MYDEYYKVMLQNDKIVLAEWEASHVKSAYTKRLISLKRDKIAYYEKLLEENINEETTTETTRLAE
jgi:hypothetical protein